MDSPWRELITRLAPPRGVFPRPRPMAKAPPGTWPSRGRGPTPVSLPIPSLRQAIAWQAGDNALAQPPLPRAVGDAPQGNLPGDNNNNHYNNNIIASLFTRLSHEAQSAPCACAHGATGPTGISPSPHPEPERIFLGMLRSTRANELPRSNWGTRLFRRVWGSPYRAPLG